MCRFYQLIGISLLSMMGMSSCGEKDNKLMLANQEYNWYSDKVTQGDYTAKALSAFEIESNYQSPVDPSDSKEKRWKLANDITAYPQYEVPFALENALYNMALDEMVNAVEPDSTLRTGKEWAGVWTRDVSYSIILSMAYMQPQVSMNSLMRKVNVNGRIVQDTGTGGAWPCSSDRMIWAVAAWEIFKVTGNLEWLQIVYPIIKNSIEDDFRTVYDKETGLVMAESSFIDWREQSYPRWMQPVDIYQSKCLGTSAVHAEALAVLSRMALLLSKPDEATCYKSKSEEVKEAINNYLWMDDKQYYAQYLYGRNYDLVSPRSETLGEALCILFDIASPERQKQIVQNMPVVPFGPPIFYPQIADIPPYHNNGVWPFVTAYWMLASAKTANETAVMRAIGSSYRAHALFVTNKENFVAENGDFKDTQINSDNMLWSLAGNISIVHKLLFGIRFEMDGLSFCPFVPEAMATVRELKNFPYRNASLNIRMEGFGNEIASFTLDGKEQAAFIPSSLKGQHTIKIVLADKSIDKQPINQVANASSPLMPIAHMEGNRLKWQSISGAESYTVFKNGVEWRHTEETAIKLSADEKGVFQVVANGTDFISFASEPIMFGLPTFTYEVEDFAPKANYAYQGFKGTGFVEVDRTKNRAITMTIQVKDAGDYAIDWRYANGNGPINTENKCAIRTLFVDDEMVGVSVLPQRGVDEWSNWGWCNPVKVSLKQGRHQIELKFLPFNENMNPDINQAMLDQLRIIKL